MGFEAFYTFLDSEIKFPENANSNIFEGYVKVLFAINPDGSISDFEIQESLGESFDKEALRVLKLVNEWSPATFNNEAVRSQLSIKLKFDRDNN
jgi:TonB family protein